MLYFIVNKTAKSGKNQDVWGQVQAILAKQDVTYETFYTEYEGHATELAKKISSLDDSDIRIVVFGGDGTIHEVINGIVDFEKVQLGIIPAGSGNDFARGTGISKNLDKNLDAIIDGNHHILLDLGHIRIKNGKSCYFAISSGFGMDAIACKKASESKLKNVLNKIHMGKLVYLIATIQSLLTMKTCRAKLRFDGRRKESYDNLIYTAAMNLRAEGGGVPMAPDAKYDDGKLSICTAHGIAKWQTFFALPFLVFAKHEKLRCFSLHDFGSCDIVLSKPMTAHADGEYLGEATHIQYECVPSRLRVIK